MLQKPEPLKTKFSTEFNIDYPVVSAPMFLVSDVNMVVATAKAGGLGAVPALNFRPVSEFKKAVVDIKTQSQKPFAINLIVQKANKVMEEQLDIIIEQKVPLIITSLGSPKKVIKRAHEAGLKVYCDVAGLEHAKKVRDLGADGLIAVSSGAGGHAGEVSPMVFIPHLKRHIDLPVLAAGGISDGIGMLAAMSLGADGIYMGTRFIASKESPAPIEYKQAIVKAMSEDIVNTDRVDGFPGNFIKTKNLEQLGLEPGFIESLLSKSKKFKRTLSLYRAGKALLSPDKTKASYKTIFSAGHGVSLIDEIKSIDEIIYKTVNEYYSLKSSLP